MSNVPWLRELVDNDDIMLLFASDGKEIRKAIAEIISLATRQSSIEKQLIRLLEIVITENNDDTQASLWICLILGEIQSRSAIFSLIQALGSSDESLREASADAIQRIGEPAFDALMDITDGTPDAEFDIASLKTLTGVVLWDHPYMLDEIRSFILKKISTPGLNSKSLEEAAMASARLGDKNALQPLKKLLQNKFGGINSFLQDAIEMIEENPEGKPIPQKSFTWEERVELLTEKLF